MNHFTYYVPQVRMINDDETMKQRCHDDSTIKAFRSFEAADAVLSKWVEEIADDFVITQIYGRDRGGGFWFDCELGEGRALVREVHVS